MSARRDGETLTIGAALRGRDNSFGALRLGFAIMVIVSHAFPLGNGAVDPTKGLFTNGQAHMGTFAVLGFLGISGYVVTKSAMRTDVMQFFWHRVLRIFPAYWVALLVVAFVFGPLAWLHSGHQLGEYFTLGKNGPIGYLTQNWTLTINQWGIHDIWRSDTPYGRIIDASPVNGSLWTLAYEWLCYVILGGLALAGILTKARVLVPITAGLLTLAVVANLVTEQSATHIMPGLGDHYRVQLLLVFFLGATAAVYSDRMPFSDSFGIASLVVLAFSLHWGGFFVIGLPAMIYAMIYLAVRLPKRVRNIGGKSDYSYAIYLYGWPVQMITAMLGWNDRLGLALWALACIAITWGLAWLSWHGLEKRVLQLKSVGPGRGIRLWANRARNRRVSFGPAQPDLAVKNPTSTPREPLP